MDNSQNSSLAVRDPFPGGENINLFFNCFERSIVKFRETLFEEEGLAKTL